MRGPCFNPRDREQRSRHEDLGHEIQHRLVSTRATANSDRDHRVPSAAVVRVEGSTRATAVSDRDTRNRQVSRDHPARFNPRGPRTAIATRLCRRTDIDRDRVSIRATANSDRDVEDHAGTRRRAVVSIRATANSDRDTSLYVSPTPLRVFQPARPRTAIATSRAARPATALAAFQPARAANSDRDATASLR